MKKHTTKVVFYLEKDSANEVFAYFPEDRADNQGNYNSYASGGQHSPCHPDYTKECKEAQPHQFEPLKKELLNVGYSLQIENKVLCRREATKYELKAGQSEQFEYFPLHKITTFAGQLKKYFKHNGLLFHTNY